MEQYCFLLRRGASSSCSCGGDAGLPLASACGTSSASSAGTSITLLLLENLSDVSNTSLTTVVTCLARKLPSDVRRWK